MASANAPSRLEGREGWKMQKRIYGIEQHTKIRKMRGDEEKEKERKKRKKKRKMQEMDGWMEEQEDNKKEKMMGLGKRERGGG